MAISKSHHDNREDTTNLRDEDPHGADQVRGVQPAVETPPGGLHRVQLLWLAGDWASLAALTEAPFHHNTDRAQLAMFTAAACLQTGADDRARYWIDKARGWGCDEDLLVRILMAGVHNSLGRAACLLEQRDRAERHFRSAVLSGCAGAEVSQIIDMRVREQTRQLAQERATHEAERSAKLGEELFHQARWQEAHAAFTDAVERNDNHAHYHYWLGEVEARLGNWDPAVLRYREALKRNPQVGVDFYRALPVQTIETGPHTVEKPIFVVGCGHSGTSIMLAMLGNHPSIRPIPKETMLFLMTDARANLMMAEWDALCAREGKLRWAEKTPPNIFQIARLLKMRPGARFVLMLRDGRDVVCSLKNRIGYKDLEARLDRWIYDNMAGLPYWGHPQVMVVKYEDLITAPEQTLRNICAFLDENYDAGMLDLSRGARRWYSDKIERPDHIISHDDHKAHRNWQINQPLFDGRGKWKEEMSYEDLRSLRLSKPFQVLMDKCGYAHNL